jgi:hypothetical protein
MGAQGGGLCSRMPYWQGMKSPKNQPKTESEDSERAAFARFAEKLGNVPKKEADEKAKEWKEGAKKQGS